MLSSSPRPDVPSLVAAHGLHHAAAPLLAPSSPTAAYHDGEISPSFDASFASSMSITSDERGGVLHLSPLPSHLRPRIPASSPVDAMDISPAPAPPQPVASSSTRTRAPAPRPLLFQRPHSSTAALPLTAAPSSNKDDHPFLKSLFKAEKSAPPSQTTFAPVAPLAIPRSSSPDDFRRPALKPFPSSSSSSTAPRAGPSRPGLSHCATVPPSNADKLRPPFQKTAFEFRASSDGLEGVPVVAHDLKGKSTAPLRPATGRTRSALPPSWSKRQTAPVGGLAPPPMGPPKRKSDSCLPSMMTMRHRAEAVESSPFRMDVDGESPDRDHRLSSPVKLRAPGHPRSVSDSRVSGPGVGAGYVSDACASSSSSSPGSDVDRSGADERLADMFGQSPGDNLSPIPQSRKRFLEQENSPTPASPTPLALGHLGGGASLGAAATRRAFEKAASTASLPLRVRRQRSAAVLRPSLNTFASLGPATATGDSFNKRHATQAEDGKPAAVPMLRASRRSNSVADPSFLCGGATAPSSASSSLSSGLGSALSARDPNVMVDLESPDVCLPLDGCVDYLTAGSRRVGASVDLGKQPGVSPEAASPIAGFRKQEAKGKALPCFGVKEDGLMRITPRTLSELQSGMYRDGVKEFIIVDCRFDYEYDGGHIDGAINLSELADIEARLLNAANPPQPSTSDCAPRDGKTVLIFHCEFSAKRAPTSAKHLRNQDRQKNFAAYPNIFYPELYILQGGYEAFFKAYPERCLGGYVVMDHPEHDAKRSLNLNKFRDQKRVFNRASSFTFGQAQHASALMRSHEAGLGKAATAGYAKARRPVSGGTFLSRQALEPTGFQFPRPSKSGAASGSSGGNSSSSGGSSSAQAAAGVSASTAALSITEEDHEGDSSFGTNGSSPGGPAGGSPCPPSSKMGARPVFKLGGMLHPRRGLERAATASVLTFSR